MFDTDCHTCGDLTHVDEGFVVHGVLCACRSNCTCCIWFMNVGGRCDTALIRC
jgi:hypothetical protein